LARKLEKRSKESGHRLMAAPWTRKAREVEKELEIVRGAMIRIEALAEAELKQAGKKTSERAA
jgi:hypothetical protein